MAIQRGDFIKVAADNWHFEHTLSGKPSFPLGATTFLRVLAGPRKCGLSLNPKLSPRIFR